MKYKKTIILLSLVVFLLSIAGVSASEIDNTIASENANTIELSADNDIKDNLQTSEENEALDSTDYDEAIAQTDTEVLGEDSAKYSDLAAEISQPGNIKLNHKNYTYDKGETITISEANKVIDGNGAVIDMTGSTIRAFIVYASGVTIKNLTIKNANYNGNGGAIYFSSSGTVTNCNFADNTANTGGAVFFSSTGGTVTNCNFTNNQATGTNSWGGAIMFDGTGNVTNCNFADNKATGTNSWGGAIMFFSIGEVSNCNFTNNTATGDGGAVYFWNVGEVTNCNFVDNKAAGDYSYGGAVYFRNVGEVTNCNFTGNNATTGSAIYFYSTSSTKTVFNSRFLNNRANAEVLEVTKNDNNITITFTGNDNLLNAIYSRNGAEVTFTNVTYWGANGITTVSATMSGSNKAAGQNITVGVVVNGKVVLNEVKVTNDNGMIVLPIIAGENYYISARHDTDSYYTEAETTISNNTKFNVNVTSKTTNNKTVNITAKSNIPNDVVKGKLLFIVPNSDPITANYAGNGTWWALHTFDGFAKYKVKASYIGFDNVTISNATVTIDRANSTITLDNVVLDYGDSIKVYVKTEGAWLITAMIDEEEVGVFKNTIPISGLDAGIHTLTVTTIPDYDHVEVTKTVNITVNKADSTLTVDNIVFDYGGSGSDAVSFTGATGVNASVIGHPDANVNVAGNTIAVSGLNVGTFNLTVTTIADANHNNITKTATITVNKLKTELKAAAISTTYNINKDLVISLTDAKGNPLSGVIIGVNLGSGKFTTDRNGQVKINVANLVPKTYTAKITFNGDTNYDKSTNDVKVTVTKATPKLTATKKTFKKSAKTKKYAVTLKDNTGKVMKKVKLTLKIKGKTYKATTNTKGKATFKITKFTKKGTFKAVVTYKGNAYYNKVTKKVKIKMK